MIFNKNSLCRALRCTAGARVSNLEAGTRAPAPTAALIPGARPVRLSSVLYDVVSSVSCLPVMRGSHSS